MRSLKNPKQIQLLRMIDQANECAEKLTMNEMCQRMGWKSLNTASYNVQRLLDKGLIVPSVISEHGRRIGFHLTERGKETIGAGKVRYIQAQVLYPPRTSTTLIGLPAKWDMGES